VRFYPPFFWHKLMSGILLVVCVHFFENFFHNMRSYFKFNALHAVRVGAERGQSHSASTRTTDDLTPRRPGRRTTLFRVDLGDGWRVFRVVLFDGRFSLKIQSSLRDDPDDGRPHSASTWTTDDLTLRRPGRRRVT